MFPLPPRRLATLVLLIAVASFAQSPAQPQADRITAQPDLSISKPISHHIPQWASPANDAGPVADTLPLRLTFVLTRSPGRQAAFKHLLDDQTNPASPRFHHWLTPAQVGEQYGPTQHDLDTLTSWLQSQGFTINELAPSRVFLTVDAPAATVANALSTSFRYFHVESQTRLSAAATPSFPAALQPLIDSISGLSEIPLQPMHHMEAVPMAAPSGSSTAPSPRFTSANDGSHFITPGDFATIFDLKPVYQSGINGANQKVAIIGRSRVITTDITGYETLTGLPANLPNVVIPTNGTDPGITNDGNQGEATLDVDRVIGTAPGVQADLVISASNSSYDGIYIAAQYEVQHLLDPVMTISFGSCEVYAGPGGVSLWDTLFAQAASQGISVFVSSGDSGAATCGAQSSTPDNYQFRSINYICASSYATCVGATQPADTANPSLYWSSTNAADRSSALSYIPEGAWNQPTATLASGQTEYLALGTGGGASIYVPKPAWQTGRGVPADNARDVPDLSFPGAGHDSYFICYNGSCSRGSFYGFSGTSASAPGAAAIVALLNQKSGTAQGNFNPLLYRIAASAPAALHDATPASSGVANCDVNTPSICNNSTPGPSSLTGGLAGYALTTGYDQATGLGSLDVANFLTAAVAPVTPLLATTLAVSESAVTITSSQSASFTATLASTPSGTPTGTVQFFADGTPLGNAVPLTAAHATTAALPFPAAGSYLISAVYSGDSSFAASTAPGITLTVAGLTSTISLNTPPATLAFGTPTSFTTNVTGTGSPAPTGLVRFYVSGVGYFPETLTNGSATSDTFTFPLPGTFYAQARYYGDTIYSPSLSPVATIVIPRIPTQATLNAVPASVTAGGTLQLSLNVAPSAAQTISAPPPTGTVQLYQNGTPLGGPFTYLGSATFPAIILSTSGIYTYTAAYSGNVYYAPISAPAVSVTVVASGPSYTLTPTAASLVLTAGSSGSDVITVTQVNAFAGTVNLACSIVYNGTGTATNPPTCALNPAQLTLSAATLSGTSSLSVASTAPGHAALALPDLPGRSTLATAAAALLLCFLPLSRKRCGPLGLVALLLAALTTLSACSGGGGGNSTPVTPGTTPGSYTVTLTGTSTGSPSVSSTINLSIN